MRYAIVNRDGEVVGCFEGPEDAARLTAGDNALVAAPQVGRSEIARGTFDAATGEIVPAAPRPDLRAITTGADGETYYDEPLVRLIT